MLMFSIRRRPIAVEGHSPEADAVVTLRLHMINRAQDAHEYSVPDLTARRLLTVRLQEGNTRTESDAEPLPVQNLICPTPQQ